MHAHTTEEFARLTAIGCPKRPQEAWKDMVKRTVSVSVSNPGADTGTGSGAATGQKLPDGQTKEARGISVVLGYARDGNLLALQSIVSTKPEGKQLLTRAKDRHGSGILLWAAGGGHLEVCIWLVNALQIDAKHTPRKDGRTAVHWAARNGHLDVCKYLITSCGVDANVTTYDGDSCFMLAAWQGHLKLCKWLVSHAKADPHQVNRWGCNAVFKAARMDGSNSSLEVFRYVVADLQVNSELINGNGHSVLHKAAIYGREDIVRYLLESNYCCGQEHVMADKLNQTPSEMARYNGFAELAGILRHHEDVLWCVPVMWQAPEEVLGVDLSSLGKPATELATE